MRLNNKKCQCCNGMYHERLHIDDITSPSQGKIGAIIPILQAVQPPHT